MYRRYKLIFIPLEYGELLAKNNCRTKSGRGWARAASKNLGPLLISATVEAINFTFGIDNLVLGSMLGLQL